MDEYSRILIEQYLCRAKERQEPQDCKACGDVV